MAAAVSRLPCSLFPHQLFFSLLALQYGPADSQTNVKVIQQPPFKNLLQGETLELSCSVNQENYYFYWYRQAPGQTELQALGTFKIYGTTSLEEPAAELKTRLGGVRKGRQSFFSLTDLQPGDRGLYLCAAKDIQGQQAYFAEQGTQVLVQDPECEQRQTPTPSALLLGPTCHKKSTTLVCVAQGFFYQWPLEVSWKRDGQDVPRLSVATEEAKEQGKCSFGVASRLAVATEEWRQGYTYLCHVSQGHVVAKAEMTSQSSQQTGSGFSDMGHSLRVGQLIFLLLAVKGFAYGTVLGVYTVCKKRGL